MGLRSRGRESLSEKNGGSSRSHLSHLGWEAVAALAAMKGASALVYAAIACAGVLFFLFSMRKYFRRAALTRKSMRKEWQDLLAARIPFYAKLEGETKERFENDVRFFASEQNIYGPRGERSLMKIVSWCGVCCDSGPRTPGLGVAHHARHRRLQESLQRRV